MVNDGRLMQTPMGDAVRTSQYLARGEARKRRDELQSKKVAGGLYTNEHSRGA